MNHPYALSVTDIAERNGFPAAEELRMVRALTQTAVRAAREQGVYRAAFRGFRIEAVRWFLPPGYGVSVEVTYAGAPYARAVMVEIDSAHDGVWLAAEPRARDETSLWESIAMARVL